MFPSTSSFWTRSRPSAISRLRRNSSHVAGASPIPRPRPASSQLCESEDRLVASCHRPDDRSHPVRDGHLVVSEPTTLPEGTVVNLVVDDEGDDLDEVERAALHAH